MRYTPQESNMDTKNGHILRARSFVDQWWSGESATPDLSLAVRILSQPVRWHDGVRRIGCIKNRGRKQLCRR